MEGRFMRTLWTTLVLLFACSSFGCVGVTSHLMFWLQGVRVDPEFRGLNDKRVALICMSDAAPYGPDLATQMLTKRISKKLIGEIKRINLISRNEIENWIDNHDWDQIDYLEIGKGVNADIVIAVELENYSLQEGSSLYRGTTNYSVHVYDLSESNNRQTSPVYEKGAVEYAFPKDHPISSIGVSQRKFEEMFINELGQQVGNYFTGYEMPDNIAREGSQSRH